MHIIMVFIVLEISSIDELTPMSKTIIPLISRLQNLQSYV
jgi:hypothetical protein